MTALYGAPTGEDPQLYELRYPIGPQNPRAELTDAERAHEIERIAGAPRLVRHAVRGLGDEQLDTPYRDGGWTIRQVVHHLADSHANMYVRVKLALTEDTPTIKPYEEARWAEAPDYAMPVEVSLRLLEALHERLVVHLRALNPDDFKRSFFHPEHDRTINLNEVLGMYGWHGEHHAAHITNARKRFGW